MSTHAVCMMQKRCFSAGVYMMAPFFGWSRWYRFLRNSSFNVKIYLRYTLLFLMLFKRPISLRFSNQIKEERFPLRAGQTFELLLTLAHKCAIRGRAFCI